MGKDGELDLEPVVRLLRRWLAVKAHGDVIIHFHGEKTVRVSPSPKIHDMAALKTHWPRLPAEIEPIKVLESAPMTGNRAPRASTVR